MTEEEELQIDLTNAIAEIMNKHEKGLVIKWALAIEMLNAEGERGLWSFCSPDAMRWDVRGMLADLEAQEIAHQTAHNVVDMMRGEEDC